jgi:cytoskeletal protein CcmA (bactofilin family)
MARDRTTQAGGQDSVISIIGPGMRVIGDCETEGSIRIEGEVRGAVRAGKAVVIGRDGLVQGDVHTQDAVVSGTILGSVIAVSRLELQATSRIDGDIQARRLQLEEGAVLNGSVQMKDVAESAPRGGVGSAKGT